MRGKECLVDDGWWIGLDLIELDWRDYWLWEWKDDGWWMDWDRYGRVDVDVKLKDRGKAVMRFLAWIGQVWRVLVVLLRVSVLEGDYWFVSTGLDSGFISQVVWGIRGKLEVERLGTSIADGMVFGWNEWWGVE